MTNNLSEPSGRKEPGPVGRHWSAWAVEEDFSGGGRGVISALKDEDLALNTGREGSFPSRGTSNEQGHSSVKLLLGAGTSDMRCLL